MRRPSRRSHSTVAGSERMSSAVACGPPLGSRSWLLVAIAMSPLQQQAGAPNGMTIRPLVPARYLTIRTVRHGSSGCAGAAGDTPAHGGAALPERRPLPHLVPPADP